MSRTPKLEHSDQFERAVSEPARTEFLEPAAREFERGISPLSSYGTSLSFSKRGLIQQAEEEGDVTKRSSGIAAEFIDASTVSSADLQTVGRQELQARQMVRACAKRIVKSPYIAHGMVLVVLLDTYLTTLEIDANAASEPIPAYVSSLSATCLVLYIAELGLWWVVRGRRLVSDWMLILDIVTVVCGSLDLVLSAVVSENYLAEISVVRVLRLVRIIRLLRLLKKNRSFKELQKLVTMLGTCLKTLLWSFLFCFMVMTIWSMLMVEIVHPYIKELSFTHYDCPQCLTLTSSVMQANLLLFKTVIAGDGWGLIAVPVIQAHPETAVIFVGSLLTLVFGVLQLIVAVVVDTFAESRENDVMALSEELEYNMDDDQRLLRQIFERINLSSDGELTLEELLEGARRDSELKSRLRVMDIDKVDLEQLFEMIDLDCSGSIAVEEFIIPLSRWVHDSKTAPRFIKYNLMRSLKQQEELLRHAHLNFKDIFGKLDHIFNVLNVLSTKECDTLTEKMTEVHVQSAADSRCGTPFVLPDADAFEQPHASQAIDHDAAMEFELALKAVAEAKDDVLWEAFAELKRSMASMETALRSCIPKQPGLATSRTVRRASSVKADRSWSQEGGAVSWQVGLPELDQHPGLHSGAGGTEAARVLRLPLASRSADRGKDSKAQTADDVV